MVDTWRYPPNWRAISRRIRARDGWRCRWCGVGDTLFDFKTMAPIRLTAMHLDRGRLAGRMGTDAQDGNPDDVLTAIRRLPMTDADALAVRDKVLGYLTKRRDQIAYAHFQAGTRTRCYLSAYVLYEWVSGQSRVPPCKQALPGGF
jgi:hypothetical protein